MSSEMYLIHREDYISHIDDKVQMYSLVKQFAHCISKLPATHANTALKEMAVTYGRIADEQFGVWGVPGSYLITGDAAELEELMENELIAPEDAGFDSEEDDGCAGCPYCKECMDGEDDETGGEDADFARAMAALSTIVHEMFGNDVTFHISIE